MQLDALPTLPERLPESAWTVVDGWEANGEHWDFRQPSHFATWSPALLAFVESLGPVATRQADPLTTARALMSAVHGGFEYAPNSTRVDSPIDEALAARARRVPGLHPRDDRGAAPARACRAAT